MERESYFLRLAIASVLLCSCDGSSTGGPAQKKRLTYSIQEDQLIINELESRARSCNFTNTWKTIADLINSKVREGAIGFSKPRSVKALKQHVCDIIKKNKSIEVPDIVKNMWEEKRIQKAFTLQEQEFINTALMSCDHIYSRATWKKIKDEHDKLREAGIPGFNNRRTPGSLRAFFTRMVREDRVDVAVKEKFFDVFLIPKEDLNPCKKRKTLTPHSVVFLESDNEDDNGIWVDDYGVDLNMFLDTRESRDNYIFDQGWPYVSNKLH